MKKTISLLTSLLLVTALIIGVTNCKKDENKVFELLTLLAGNIDLNGTTSANTVPSDPTITATFSIDVDAATVSAAVIKLMRDYDDADVALTLTVTGKTITIVPGEGLGNGSLYKLSFLAGIKATDGQLLTAFDRAFTTVGTFTPAGQIAYWSFENTADDQVGTFNPSADGIVDLTYEDSYNPAAGKCAFFNGTSTIIEIADGDQLTNTENFTLAFWVKTKSEGHNDAGGNPKGHFVVGLGASRGFQFEIDGAYASCKLAATYNINNTGSQDQDLWFSGNGEYNGNGGWKGWTFCKLLTPTPADGMAAILKDKWAHVVCVYDGPTKIGTMYLNGEKMKEQDFNLYDPPLNTATGMKWNGDGIEVVNKLAFGFIKSREGTLFSGQPWGNYELPTANHFGGWLDNVRIFHKALTAQEIDLMYQSEKP